MGLGTKTNCADTFTEEEVVILFYTVELATLKKTKNGFQDQLSLNVGQKHCRMLPLEHSEKLLTFIKLPFVIKIFVLSIFEWPLKTGFTVTVWIRQSS